MLATALAPVIGYDEAAKLAKEALKSGPDHPRARARARDGPGRARPAARPGGDDRTRARRRARPAAEGPRGAGRAGPGPAAPSASAVMFGWTTHDEPVQARDQRRAPRSVASTGPRHDGRLGDREARSPARRSSTSPCGDPGVRVVDRDDRRVGPAIIVELVGLKRDRPGPRARLPVEATAGVPVPRPVSPARHSRRGRRPACTGDEPHGRLIDASPRRAGRPAAAPPQRRCRPPSRRSRTTSQPRVHGMSMRHAPRRRRAARSARRRPARAVMPTSAVPIIASVWAAARAGRRRSPATSPASVVAPGDVADDRDERRDGRAARPPASPSRSAQPRVATSRATRPATSASGTISAR